MLLSDGMLRNLRYSRRHGSGRKGNPLALVGLVFIILSPIVAKLMQLALSRQREFLADATAAQLTRYPEGLAAALEKLAADSEPLEAANKATAHMYIINPLTEHKGWANSLFSTHPSTEERVKRLREM